MTHTYLADEFKKDFFNKSENAYNKHYKAYLAAFVHSTKLPTFSSSTYSDKPINFLSKSKCKDIKMPISDKELPVAWYRGRNGFFPLYFREFELTEEVIKIINKRY